MENRIFIGDVVFCLAIGFLAGALAAGLGWKLPAVVAATVAIIGVAAILPRKITPAIHLTFAALFFAGTMTGFFYYFLATNANTVTNKLPIEQQISFKAIVISAPKPSTKYLLLPAQIQSPFAGEITIFTTLSSTYQYGDELAMAGKLEAPESLGDTPAIFPKKIELVAEGRGFWLEADMLHFKASVLKELGRLLPSNDAALVAGELFGGTDGMSATLKNEMEASGTSYVLSMYGYKISLLIFLIEASLKLWLNRRIRFFIAAAAIFAVVIFSGGNISAIRAALMACIALVAKLTGRAFDPRNALVFVAAAMTLIDPTLPAQASFELSLFSIVGIFYLVAPLEHVFHLLKITTKNFAAEAVIVAAATLLPIVPIIAVSFGDFSLSAFPSNALISFAILPTMIFGAALAIFGAIIPSLAVIVAKLGQPLLFYQLFVIKLFAFAVSMPLPVEMPIIFIAYYAALAWFAWWYGFRRLF